MQGYIGYIRVSTVKQGTQGVSLEEQKDAILRYAERKGLPIEHWLEEQVTAAKQGRPVFNHALKLLRTGEAKGIILHKLDRGARNLRDWMALRDFSDKGIEVHFVHESLDLHTRGGRLSADIQAVVAADFIRNLKDETRKGMQGRLKQGFYPLPAPIGYLNHGKAKAKTICPKKGPLARKAFQMYATGRYTFDTLCAELRRAGLRNRRGRPITNNGLTTMLNNPFYLGLIRIKRTNETFIGNHKPLISKELFDRVQQVLRGNVNPRSRHHDFQYRRMIVCRLCDYSLIGELQKGRVYYRCHSKTCKGTAIREDAVTQEIERFLRDLTFDEDEKACAEELFRAEMADWAAREEEESRSRDLVLSQIKDRINRLTDAYLDHVLDRTAFQERKNALMFELQAAEESAKSAVCGVKSLTKIKRYIELAANPLLSHQNGFPEQKRDLVKILTSNLWMEGKKLVLKPSLPFEPIVNRPKTHYGDPYRDGHRTFKHILQELTTLNNAGKLPDLLTPSGCVETVAKRGFSRRP